MNVAQLFVVALAGVGGLSSRAGAAQPESGPIPNRPPVFVGYPYGQQIADFTKLGGNDYVFTRTVVDPDPGDVVTMLAYLEGSPFTFSFTPGNPAVYEVRASNLGPAAIGGYIVDLRAFDGNATNGFAIGAINIVIIPEPAINLGLAAVAILLRRVRRSASERIGARNQSPSSGYDSVSASKTSYVPFEFPCASACLCVDWREW